MSALFLFVFLLKTFAAPLSQQQQGELSQTLQRYQKAQGILLERVSAFNRGEKEYKTLENSYLESSQVLSAILNITQSSLNWTLKEKQDLLKAHANQNKKTYDQMLRSKLLQLYQQTRLTRNEWEAIIDDARSAELQRALEEQQVLFARAKAEEARQLSQSQGIYLRALSQEPQRVKEFCQQIPKGGMLHTHPYGTMDRSTVQEVLNFFNPKIQREQLLKYQTTTGERLHKSELDFLEKHSEFYTQERSYQEILNQYPEDAIALQNLFFMPKSPLLFDSHLTPFSRFLASFTVPLDMLGIFSGRTDVQVQLERIIYKRFFTRSLSQHVQYAELTRSLPILTSSKKFADRYQELGRWTMEMEQQLAPFVPRALYSFSRTNLESDEKQLQQVQMMTELLSAEPSFSLVGINLVGDETERSALDTAQFIYGKLLLASPTADFSRFHLKPTMHAGELGDIRNVRDAMIFGVLRLGHAVLLTKNPLHLEYARRLGVAVESNLTSNAILGVSPVHQNPFLYFLRLGLKVSLSTDDEGIFETDSNQECELALLQTDIEYVELKQMMLNSLETAFVDNATKDRLLKKLLTDFVEFEKRWKK